jgi:hypothetical protein
MKLRQSYLRLAKRAAMMAGRYARADEGGSVCKRMSLRRR